MHVYVKKSRKNKNIYYTMCNVFKNNGKYKQVFKIKILAKL